MPRAPGKPPSKVAQLKAAMGAGDWALALRIAARFPRLGKHKAAIVLGHEASTNAGQRLYRQLGHDPEVLKAAGKQALLERFGR